MTDRDADGEQLEPRPAAVAFVTTEHFTRQGARSSTIAEATGRATMSLGTVSGGLVALGLTATAGGVHTAFYAFALILLPTLALVGLVTFTRVLQSGVEDLATQAGSRDCAVTTFSTRPNWPAICSASRRRSGWPRRGSGAGAGRSS